MTALNLALLGGVGPGPDRIGTPRIDRTVPTLGAENRFSTAMDRAAVHDAGVKVAQVGPVNLNAPQVQPASSIDAQERARRTLELDAVRAKPGSGDTILDGLQKLRGVFDVQQGKLNAAMNGSATDANAMLALQVEVVNFSLLVDVTSKLTGKSTQAFETLLKGQ